MTNTKKLPVKLRILSKDIYYLNCKQIYVEKRCKKINIIKYFYSRHKD